MSPPCPSGATGLQHQVQLAAPRENALQTCCPHCWRVWAPGRNGRGASTARDTTRTILTSSSAGKAHLALGASSQHQPGASGGEARGTCCVNTGRQAVAAAGWLTCHIATAPQCWREGHRGAEEAWTQPCPRRGNRAPRGVCKPVTAAGTVPNTGESTRLAMPVTARTSEESSEPRPWSQNQL